MDSMADECFVLQSIRGKVDPETLDEVRRALSNIAARSRHIGKHLIEVSRVQTPEEEPGGSGKDTHPPSSPNFD